MFYIQQPASCHARPLSFYLAMEEYVARHVLSRLPSGAASDGCFLLWQVQPSVIFGRNQVAAHEVNVGYCRQHGIRMYRRKSGGGCVYADEGNLMLSYVTAGSQVGLIFHRFVNMLLLVLRRLGIEAVGTEHNDVLIGGRKVSGTAYYQLPGSAIVHGTLLYDTRMEHMLHAITPPPEKLQRKGVESVRQRITLLREHTTLTIDELKQHIVGTLCSGEYALPPADVAAIEQLEQSYLREEFIHLL